jgi:hypothetical protein
MSRRYEKRYDDEAFAKLQKEYQKLQDRIDAMYKVYGKFVGSYQCCLSKEKATSREKWPF